MDTREFAWEKLGTQDQPSTKETTHQNPTRVRRASTKRRRSSGSLDTITTMGVRNLQLADIPAAQPVSAVGALPAMPNSRRPTQQRVRQQRAYFQCPQCGADPHAHVGHSDSGLVAQMSQKHGGQTLTPGSVAQLRQIDLAACVICGAVRSRRGNRCNHCRADTATRVLVIENVSQDRRQPGHQELIAAGPSPQTSCRFPVPPGTPLDDSPTPSSPVRDIVTTESEWRTISWIPSPSLHCIALRHSWSREP